MRGLLSLYVRFTYLTSPPGMLVSFLYESKTTHPASTIYTPLGQANAIGDHACTLAGAAGVGLRRSGDHLLELPGQPGPWPC